MTREELARERERYAAKRAAQFDAARARARRLEAMEDEAKGNYVSECVDCGRQFAQIRGAGRPKSRCAPCRHKAEDAARSARPVKKAVATRVSRERDPCCAAALRGGDLRLVPLSVLALRGGEYAGRGRPRHLCDGCRGR